MSTYIQHSAAGRWSGGGQNLVDNIAFAENLYPSKFSESGRPVIAKNLVPFKTFCKGGYVYMPQNAWAWHGPVQGVKEWIRRSSIRVFSELATRRAVKSIRIGPMIPEWKHSGDEMLPNVLDEGFEHSLIEAKNLGRPSWLPKNDFLLVPGSMWGYRNHTVVLEAFEVYRASGGEMDIVFVGPGEYFPLKKDISKLVDQGIHLINQRKSRANVLAAMINSNICLLPSHVEASPVTMLEAAAIGLPMVASDIDAHRGMAHLSGIDNIRFANSVNEFAAAFATDRHFELGYQSSLSYRNARRKWWAEEFIRQAGGWGDSIELGAR